MSATAEQIAAHHRDINKAHSQLICQLQEWVKTHADGLSATFIEGDNPRFTATGQLSTRERAYGVSLAIERKSNGDVAQELNIFGCGKKRYRMAIESGPSITQLLQDFRDLSNSPNEETAVNAAGFLKRFMFPARDTPARVYDMFAENEQIGPVKAFEILRDTQTVTPADPNAPTLGQSFRRRIGEGLLQLE